MATNNDTTNLTNRDPKAGCAIMIIGALIFGGLILYSLLLPFVQSGEMKKFTQLEPNQLETSEVIPLSNNMKERLQTGLQELEASESPVVFSFTIRELNAFISAYPEFKELKGTLSVKEIKPEMMSFDISFPLRGKPFSKETPYLNGTLYAKPELYDGEILLRTKKIDSQVGDVPEGFLKHFDSYRIMAPYRQHDVLGRVMPSAIDITLENDLLTISVDPTKYRDPQILPELEKDDSNERKQQNIMLVISFLVVSGLFFFMVKRRNKFSVKELRR